ncbi:MAG: peptidylprolyl isomerase [Bdellovibrionales bacterium]
MKSVFYFILFAVSIAVAQQNAVVADVNGKKITVEDFNKKYSEILEVVSMNGGPAPSKSEFLEELVRFELGLAEASKRNMEKDPVVLERYRQEMYKVLLEKELGQKAQKIQVTEAEMKAWYAKNPSIRWSNIVIEVKPGATPEQKAEAKKRAQEIYSDVKGSKRPYEELVRLYSDDTLSKQFGGDSGWQSPVTVMPQIYDAAKKAKVGEIIGPIETLFGFHIMKITGRATFEQANRVQIRQAVFNEKRRDLLDDYFAKLKKQYPVKTNPSVLK